VNTEPVEYRDVPNFVGYRVGTDGSVWSRWERYYTPGVSGSRYRLGDRWHQLAPVLNSHGRSQVALGRGRIRAVHRLVLEAFVGPCPPGMEGCHGDGNPANNALPNLRWDSHSGNQLDAVRHGTHTTNRGGTNGNASLTDDKATAVRADRAAGMTYPELAAKYGVSVSTIKRVVRRHTFTGAA
jgi:hypothetical protein